MWIKYLKLEHYNGLYVTANAQIAELCDFVTKFPVVMVKSQELIY